MVKGSGGVLAALALLSMSVAQAQQSAPSPSGERSGAAVQQSERQQTPGGRTQAPGSSARQSDSTTRGSIGVASPTAGSQQRSGAADKEIATWLVIGNQAEVALGNLAQQQAEHPAVKQFAQKMVQDHTQFIQKLQQTAGASSGSTSAPTSSFEAERRALDQRASSSEGTAGTSAQRSQRAGGESGSQQKTQSSTSQPSASGLTGSTAAQSGQSSGQVNWISLKQQLAERHLETLRAEFENKQGAAFDKAYMTQQVMQHMLMLDELELFQQHVSADLQQVLQEGTATTQHHLAAAKQLVEQLEKQDAGGQIGRSPTSQPGVSQPGQRPGASRTPGQPGQPGEVPSSRPQPPSAPSAQPQP